MVLVGCDAMTDSEPDIPMPPHAFVPGATPRHPAGIFDDLKASVTLDTKPAELHKSLAFRAGKHYFAQGYFWECHEALEHVWRQTDDPSAERDMIMAFIQLANARLKIKIRQPRAALRLCEMVEAHLARCPEARAVLGLHVADMLDAVREARSIAKQATRSF